mmetsp:Transcript_18106/g.30563  ORF Transcript_18106/g.30563 Transcript_18106/m.30563 type:complete len:419 (+) Transcript_18106:34-1290(+)
MASVWALLFLSAAATELRHRGAGPLCSCDCCSVAQRRPDERKNQMGLKCAPSEGHSRELCSSQCRPSDEAVGFLAKDRLLDYTRFCFYDCKPPQGHLSALASQCLSLKDSQLQQALDADGNAMDPAFLYEAPAVQFPVALAEGDGAKDAKDPAKAKAVAMKAHKAFNKLENATEDVEELWDSDVATEIPDATQDPLVAASGARRAAQRAEDAAVRAKRAAERSIEALKTGRNDTWMAAMWKANEALNTMKRNDFRQATAAQRPDAPLPWRVRAAEAARSAAEPYLEAQQHYTQTLPQLQREAALSAMAAAEKLRLEAEHLKAEAAELRSEGDVSKAEITERMAAEKLRAAEAKDDSAKDHLAAAKASMEKAEDEGYLEHAQVAADEAVQNVKLPVRYQLALPPDPLRNWAPTAPRPTP